MYLTTPPNLVYIDYRPSLFPPLWHQLCLICLLWVDYIIFHYNASWRNWPEYIGISNFTIEEYENMAACWYTRLESWMKSQNIIADDPRIGNWLVSAIANQLLVIASHFSLRSIGPISSQPATSPFTTTRLNLFHISNLGSICLIEIQQREVDLLDYHRGREFSSFYRHLVAKFGTNASDAI